MSITSPIERRRIRLRNDHISMENIRTSWLSWKPLQGSQPFVEQYELNIRLRTIIGPGPQYRDSHVIRVTLGPDYPVTAAPVVQMVTTPQPFHPNWFSSGRWCFGTWLVYEGLGAHVIRMIQTLQFNEEITNEASAANGEARSWYLANRSRGWFPCDRTPLPDPTGKPAPPAKKKFDIR